MYLYLKQCQQYPIAIEQFIFYALTSVEAQPRPRTRPGSRFLLKRHLEGLRAASIAALTRGTLAAKHANRLAATQNSFATERSPSFGLCKLCSGSARLQQFADHSRLFRGNCSGGRTHPSGPGAWNSTGECRPPLTFCRAGIVFGLPREDLR